MIMSRHTPTVVAISGGIVACTLPLVSVIFNMVEFKGG